MTPRRHRARTGVAAGVTVVASLVACSAQEPTAAPTPAPPSSMTPSPVPTGPADPSARPSRRAAPITVAVAGDLHFEGALRDLVRRPAALGRALAPLAAADVAVVNLETSVGSGGRPAPDKRYTFQAPPSAFAALAAGGVDVATMANNHALDFGREPLDGTFAAIDAAAAADPALAVVGIGRDADDAFRPALVDVDATVVATLGATTAGLDPTADPTGQWAATESSPGTADAIDPARLLRAVSAADRTADVVVVYVHWGVQGERCPDDDQRSLATDLVEAGADVVVGSHAHRLQGDGRLRGGYVAYGLGNYAWYTQTGVTATTGVLRLTVVPPRARAGRARVTRAEWAPARIAADGLPVPVTGAATAAFEAERAALRACAGLAG